MRFLTLGIILSVAVSAAPIGPGHGHWNGPWWHHNAAKAVYFLDDDPSGSSVVSLKVSYDGRLSDPVRTSTDGFGSIGVNGTGFPNQADALMSQGAVVVSGDVGSPCSISPHAFAVLGETAAHQSLPGRL
jgi:hypothetical protein